MAKRVLVSVGVLNEFITSNQNQMRTFYEFVIFLDELERRQSIPIHLTGCIWNWHRCDATRSLSEVLL